MRYYSRAVKSLAYRTTDVHKQADLLAEVLEPHKKVIFIALGKSLHAVRLAASIANSYGLRWYCIDAGNALHGDIGIIGPTDIVILVSNSGTTREVLEVGTHLKNHDKISITGQSVSPLSNLCTMNVVLAVPDEHSPYAHAPMTSSIIQAMFINEVVNTLVQLHNLPVEQYAANHPAGKIGQAVRIVQETLTGHLMAELGTYPGHMTKEDLEGRN